MKANPLFLQQTQEFWAYVKTISQQVGYTDRQTKAILVPTIENISQAFHLLNLSLNNIKLTNGSLTNFGKTLLDYFQYRHNVLETHVKPILMNKDIAEKTFKLFHKNLNPNCLLPLNKQKGDKKNYAFLTCLVNMLLEKELSGLPCNLDPRQLTTVTQKQMPLRTLSRRVDGAFPSIINPIAIWEIKEYYYTTTFGSRVADGVYETLLDGLEIQELEKNTGIKIYHILIIDDYFTWWVCGRSYLCRIIDMLNMGLVDEVIFGGEVITRIPTLAKEWKTIFNNKI